MSNTKLNTGQKANRKFWRDALKGVGGAIAASSCGRVTVAVERTGKHMGVFSLAIASPAEVKARKSVGQHMALYRMYVERASLPVPLNAKADAIMWPSNAEYLDDAEYLKAVAADLAEFFASM